MRAGGILGASKDDSSSSEDEYEVFGGRRRSSEQSVNKVPGYHESNQFPFPLFPPGLPVFVHTPHLITELYPPGYYHDKGDRGGPLSNLERTMIIQQNPEVLSQLICERWFLLCYRQKPCPAAIWQWLFQIMCLSCDQYLTERVYFNLKTLVDWSIDVENVYVPGVGTVMDVLVNLGADKDLLEGEREKRRSTESGLVASPIEDSVFQVPLLAGNVLVNLSNLFRYISNTVTAHSSALNCEDLQQLLLLSATVSLDCSVAKDPAVLGPISQCISSLAAAIPEASWPAVLASLSTRLVQLSPHHHDLFHLGKLLAPSSTRAAQLRMGLCRAGIWKLVYPDVTYRHMSDCSFAWTVVEHYYNMPAAMYGYYSMYSVVCMLSIFVNLSTMQWPSPERKKDFKTMLKKVANVKIRDIAESSERAPVKDMLINMALEMSTRGKSRQTDLFSVLGN
jgi:hypothetical protein